MASFREIVLSSVLIGIFIFAIIGYGVTLSNDNALNNTILDNEAINRSYIEVQNNLTQISTNANAQKTSFFEDVPIIGDINLILRSVAGMTRIFFDIMTGSYSLFVSLITETIGIPEIVLNGITAILLITTLLLVWRVYRAGS